MASTTLDVRVLAEAFPPTTTAYSTENTPAKSADSVLLPACVLSDLNDPFYIGKLRESSVTPSNLVSEGIKSAPGASTSGSLAAALRSDSHKGLLATGSDNRTRTTNGAGAFSSTKDAVLDAFFGLGQWSNGTEVHGRLTEAWAQDPDTTLRLIFNLRSIHEGKNARDLFFHAFGWLYREHPRTAIVNLDQLVSKICEDPRNVAGRKKWEKSRQEKDATTEMENADQEFVERPARSHGCWKDLLSIVSLAFIDRLGDKKMDPELLKTWSGPAPLFRAGHVDCNHPVQPEQGTVSMSRRLSEHKHTTQNLNIAEMHAQEWKQKAKDQRRSRHELGLRTLERKLEQDWKFRSLYVAVARLFGDALIRDIHALVEIVNLRKVGDLKSAITIRKLGDSMSLAAKWAPSIGKSFDRQFLMTSAIAQVLFPFNGAPDSPEREVQTHKARNMLRRFILTPLRNFLAVPESNMHPGKWDKIAYPRVPAVCFTTNKSLFWHHDEQRFVKHLDSVGKGKRTISGSALLPHEILIGAIDASTVKIDGDQQPRPARGRGSSRRRGSSKVPMLRSHYDRAMRRSLGKLYTGIYDAQWSSMLEHVTSLGNLDNCIAVCDVSGSMGSIHQVNQYIKDGQYDKAARVSPIFPAIALSIIVAQIAAAPFHNLFITFSARPQLIELLERSSDGSPAGLGEIAKAMSNADWGQNTNFTSVFLDLLLPTAKRHQLTREQMVKRVFVFSDMQFDAAQSGGPWGRSRTSDEWKTAHQVVKAKFEQAGYDMPELVYWNLAGGRYAEGMGLTAPVEKDEMGVTLMSGFSGSMLKAFVGFGDEAEAEIEKEQEWDDADIKLEVPKENAVKEKASPADKMKKVLSAKSYAGLRVYD
ncbi:hypothetical protein CALCODRAFT_496088 [Calocera cornea HHB12733]|uniref:Uncharacterized protein n=1 Tax=Calocera cornea HHB12733 TaxID=1353952 RepID=A0A165G0I3_9BASI|nr:hypothetical protein CALCODRAFT_496088 [Calocera cornea HHB12733]